MAFFKIFEQLRDEQLDAPPEVRPRDRFLTSLRQGTRRTTSS